MHTGKGLQVAMEFLEKTGVGSQTWILGPRKDLVGGLGWSHIRDDGEKGREEDGEAGRRGTDEAEEAGVGQCFFFVLLRLVWNFCFPNR